MYEKRISDTAVLYGIYRQRYVIPAAVSLGILLLSGALLQVFYHNGRALLLHLILAGTGLLLSVLFCTWSRSWLRDNFPPVGSKILIFSTGCTIFVLIFLVVFRLVSDQMFLSSFLINGGGITIRTSLGTASVYPGDILKLLLILLAGDRIKKRHHSLKHSPGSIIYFILSALSAASLALFGDTGNAVIILILTVISSAWLYGKQTAWKTAFLSAGGICLAFFLLPDARDSLRECGRILTGSIQWKSTSLTAVLEGGLYGLSAGHMEMRDIAEAVDGQYYNITDAFNILTAIYGFHALTALSAAVILMLLLIPRLTVRKNRLHMYSVLGLTALFLQYTFHVGGNLNCLPFQMTAPFISSDISGMIFGFLIFGIVARTLTDRQEQFYAVHVRHAVYVRWTAAAGVLFLLISSTGFWQLSQNAGTAVGLLGYRTGYEWGTETADSLGSVYGSDGSRLWGFGAPVSEDLESLLGATGDYAFDKSTVLSLYSSRLTGSGSYCFSEGARSMKNSGQDLFLTIDPEINRQVYEYLQNPFSENAQSQNAEPEGTDLHAVEPENSSGMAVLMKTGTGAILSATAFSSADTAFHPDWEEALKSLRMVSAVANGGVLAEPYLTEEIRDQNEKVLEQHQRTTTRLMDEHEANVIYQMWQSLSGASDRDLVLSEKTLKTTADGSEVRRFTGYSRETDTAFYIEIQVSPTPPHSS